MIWRWMNGSEILIVLCYRVFSFAFTMFSALGPAPRTNPVSRLASRETEGGEDGEHAQRCSDQELGQARPQDKDMIQPVVKDA